MTEAGDEVERLRKQLEKKCVRDGAPGSRHGCFGVAAAAAACVLQGATLHLPLSFLEKQGQVL